MEIPPFCKEIPGFWFWRFCRFWRFCKFCNIIGFMPLSWVPSWEPRDPNEPNCEPNWELTKLLMETAGFMPEVAEAKELIKFGALVGGWFWVFVLSVVTIVGNPGLVVWGFCGIEEPFAPSTSLFWTIASASFSASWNGKFGVHKVQILKWLNRNDSAKKRVFWLRTCFFKISNFLTFCRITSSV